jgi:hypothetical protein
MDGAGRVGLDSVSWTEVGGDLTGGARLSAGKRTWSRTLSGKNPGWAVGRFGSWVRLFPRPVFPFSDLFSSFSFFVFFINFAKASKKNC